MTAQNDPGPAGDEVVPALALLLMQHSHEQTTGTMNSLIDSYREEAARANAELTAIRYMVRSLFAGPYLPHPEAVMRALYPGPELIARARGGQLD